MSFSGAIAAAADIRKHITSHSDPVAFDTSIALEKMCRELDRRLAQIEQQQRELSHQVSSIR